MASNPTLVGAILFIALLSAQVLRAAPAEAANPPTPPKAQVSGIAQDDRFAAAIYTVSEPGKDAPLEHTYLELFARQGGGYARASKVRIPRGIGRDCAYAIQTIDLGGGRQVIRFEATPSGDDSETVGRDSYLGIFSGQRPYTTIWSGSVDAFDPRQRVDLMDVDGDGDLEVVLAQLDAGVLFCGRSHARLFPKVWDFAAERFVKAPLRHDIANEALVVEARMDTEAPQATHFPDLISFRSASSDLSEASRGGQASIPTTINDGSAATAWIEGASGWGRGEFVTADVNQAFAMRGLRIVPGNAASGESWATHGVPSALLISFDDGQWIKVKLPLVPLRDLLEAGGLYVEFPTPKISRCVTVTMLDVAVATRRTPHQRSAISELTPLIDLDYDAREVAIGRLVEQLSVEESPRRRRELASLARGLDKELAPALAAMIDAELAPEAAPTGRLSRLIPLLAMLPTEAALPLIARILAFEPLTGTEQALIHRALSFDGSNHVDALTALALAEGTSPLVRSRAVRIVGRAGSPEIMHQLVPLLGQGDGELRRSVVRGLSRAPIGVADALLEVAAQQPGTEAAHDALWVLDRLSRKHLSGQGDTLPGAERVMRAYNDTEDVQTRLRAARLMTRVDAPNADVFLITVLQSKERPEIREIVAGALAQHPGDKATLALIDALEDESPAVRFQAVRALNTRSNQPRVVDAALAYAQRETWKQGRTLAFRLLASSAHRKGADHLYAAIDGQDKEMSLMALAAINAARTNIRPLALARLIRDNAADLRLRQEAVQALAWASDPDSERLLIEVLKVNDYDEELRAAAARSMGIRRTPQTLQALLETVSSSGRPLLQRACVRSLAFYNSREAHKTLIGLRSRIDLRTRKYLEESIKAIEERLDR